MILCAPNVPSSEFLIRVTESGKAVQHIFLVGCRGSRHWLHMCDVRACAAYPQEILTQAIEWSIIWLKGQNPKTS